MSAAASQTKAPSIASLGAAAPAGWLAASPGPGAARLQRRRLLNPVEVAVDVKDADRQRQRHGARRRRAPPADAARQRQQRLDAQPDEEEHERRRYQPPRPVRRADRE